MTHGHENENEEETMRRDWENVVLAQADREDETRFRYKPEVVMAL